eukprot:CAMPEP_0185690914 /NCGR_PEP_ID=MMETSP1164-20130828/1444_1 /TAXON_ID=1104430 /ORGANISM="Chrysoreinhardia sp, Strain CCMP2950" /LENGTH=161 /DNA_ID=CAMNT_0028357529 /DNA_START=62 /DNA_END=547 /DNA_ORIENTATION=-
MSGRAVDPIDEADIILVFGCCCCNQGFICEKCLGIACEQACCCIEHYCCLKPGARLMLCGCGGGDGKVCQLGLGCCAIGLVCPPQTIIKNQQQCLCLVGSCAIPPSNDIPATVACYGLSLYPKCGCCVRLKDQRGAPPAAEGASGVAWQPEDGTVTEQPRA